MQQVSSAWNSLFSLSNGVKGESLVFKQLTYNKSYMHVTKNLSQNERHLISKEFKTN
jgi:hypothetical protein